MSGSFGEEYGKEHRYLSEYHDDLSELTDVIGSGEYEKEAGMGSTPHAHAIAKVDKPHDQGVVAMIGVFIDTFVVLTLTDFFNYLMVLPNAVALIALGSIVAKSASEGEAAWKAQKANKKK